MTFQRAARPDLPTRPADVIGFNAAPFLLGPVGGLVAMAVALTSLPLVVRVIAVLAGVLAILWTFAAVATTWWVFGARAERRWAWVEATAGRPRRWLNLTTGFDDSTATLRRRLDADGRAVDVFDPTIDHEPALRRARRRYPVGSVSVAPSALEAAIETGVFDTVFLLMAAHETHGAQRQALFRVAARTLRPEGRLVLVEHLRDIANLVAFGPGAMHFATRADWLAVAAESRLTLVEETRLTPFVAGFVFRREVDR
jgi:SAM-dependent methyltransferase